jgi:hypothetical protein
MWSLRQADHCSDFANGVASSVVQNTKFKSDFAKKIQEMYQRNLLLPDEAFCKKSHISKVKIVICLGNRKIGSDRITDGKEYRIQTYHQVSQS